MAIAHLRDLLLVGAGGFLGAVSRYVMSGLVHRMVPFATFPAGTLAVNAVGCLAIGVLGGLADARSVIGHEARLFMFLGVLGGFTTFSTFGYETLGLVRDGEHGRAALSIALHFSLCLGGAWVGYTLASAR